MATCPTCKKNFSNKHSLDQHNSYFKGSCITEMTEDEYNLLAPLEEDYSKVLCKACGKELAKRGVFTHIHKHHPEFFDDSWGGL